MKRPEFPAAVELEHLRAERTRVEQTLPTLEAELRARRLELKSEELDVERAQGEGLVAFFERLVGEKRQQLLREKAEAAAARFKFDKSGAALEAARARLVDLRLQIERLEGTQQRVEERLARTAPAKAVHELQLELREIEEAQTAAARALQCIEWIDSSLHSAKNWGTYDMLGGGMIATWVKHSRLDEASGRMASLQMALRRLAKELKDVGGVGPGSLKLDGFTSFADYFLDGFFVDWMVQRQIHDSIQRVATLRGRVRAVQADLAARERRASEELALLPPG